MSGDRRGIPNSESSLPIDQETNSVQTSIDKPDHLGQEAQTEDDSESYENSVDCKEVVENVLSPKQEVEDNETNETDDVIENSISHTLNDEESNLSDTDHKVNFQKKSDSLENEAAGIPEIGNDTETHENDDASNNDDNEEEAVFDPCDLPLKTELTVEEDSDVKLEDVDVKLEVDLPAFILQGC